MPHTTERTTMPHDTHEIRAVKAALRRDYALNGQTGASRFGCACTRFSASSGRRNPPSRLVE